MATTDVIDRPARATELEPDPLLTTTVSLAPGMQVWVDKHFGDVPLMGITTNRTHLIVSVDAGEAAGIDIQHAAVAEEFATAACAFRDELRELLAAREPAS